MSVVIRRNRNCIDYGQVGFLGLLILPVIWDEVVVYTLSDSKRDTKETRNFVAV